MTSAQDEFKRMLRGDIAPALRQLGMKGSGRNYVLPNPDHHLLVGFQGDRYNTADDVRFTVNLAVISKHDWEQGWQPWWGKPSATMQGPVGTYLRLGLFMPEQDDVWWELSPGTDVAALAAEVVQAIQQFGIPGLLQVRSGDWDSS